MSISRSAQDYLKHIYKLQASSGTVQTSILADRMGVAAPSATNMVARLAEAGFLRHTPYRGVALTEQGARVALEVIRHHRLWEAFLHQALGVPIDQLHGEAERLEHDLSDELEAHIVRHLGDPLLDPHGDPIPDHDGQLVGTAYPTLASAAEGQRAAIRRVPDEDPAFLRYIESRGLLPGATVEMRHKEPFRGPMTVAVGGTERVIGFELASKLYVELVD